mmetsp:Transcript_8534/g.21803  ORF Transcript_8534/g.21803 Transcript_8534/m.21803 type:complete len:83 (+) Transcript_8534:878-1126(+)
MEDDALGGGGAPPLSQDAPGSRGGGGGGRGGGSGGLPADPRAGSGRHAALTFKRGLGAGSASKLPRNSPRATLPPPAAPSLR